MKKREELRQLINQVDRLDRQIGLHRKLRDGTFNQELITAGAEHAQVV